MKFIRIFFLAGLLLMAFNQSALAAATSVSIKMQQAKIAMHVSGDGYAINQPTIRVLSTGGEKYDALDTMNMKFSITTKASYTPNWIVTDHAVTFSGKDDSVKLNKVEKSGHYQTKYIPPKFAMSPISLCNNEVNIKGAKSMADGFVVKIQDAYTIKYKAKFKRVVLQTSHSKSDTVNSPVWVVCEKTKTAKQDVEKQALPFLKTAALTVSPQNYKGICPAEIKHFATFRVNGSGEIKYAFIGEDGSKGPQGTLKYTKAGSKTATWNRKIAMPKPKPGSLSNAQVAVPDNKYNGTTTVHYTLFGHGNKIGASSAPKKVSFKVQCVEPKKAPARVQKPAPLPAPLNLQGIEVQRAK